MKNNYLAIVIACDYEIDLTNIDLEKIQINNQTYFVHKNKVVLMFCGIGKVNAAYNLGLLSQNFNITAIINIGSGLGINNSNIFDVLMSTGNQYGDVDITADSKYEINQMVGCPKIFKTSTKINDYLKKILLDLNYKFLSSQIMTTDCFVTNQNYFKFNEIDNSNINAIDMECCALAQVANNLKIEFSAIKVISDTLKQTENNHNDFVKNMKIIAKMITNIVNKIFLSNIFS